MGYWDQFAVESPLRHMWSLAIEEQFYVVFPLVVMAVLAWRRQALGWVLAAATVASWTTALVLLATGTRFERVYLGTDTRVGAITLGALAGYLTTRPATLHRLQPWARRTALPAAGAILVLLVALAGDVQWTAQRWLVVISFELAGAIVLVAALDGTSPLNRLMSLRWLGFFGAISYGLYLWHIPVQLVTERVRPGLHPVALAAVVLTVSSTIAWCSWKFIEAPIRRDGIAALGRFRLVPQLASSSRAATGYRVTAAGLTVIAVVGSVGAIAAFTTTVGDRAPGAENLVSATLEIPPPEIAEIVVPEPGVAASVSQTGLPITVASGRTPRVLLAGDSMARDMEGWLIEHQDELGVVASASSHVGCGTGGMMVEGNDSLFDAEFVASCDRWRTELPAATAQVAPDVVLMTRLSRRQPAEGTTECDPGYRQWYRSSLRDEVSAIEAASETRVVVATIPYNRWLDVDPNNDRAVDCLNAELASLANTGEILVVDLGGWTCRNSTCRLQEDGVTLRPDGLHFSGPGAGIALRWMFAEIFNR